MSSEKKSFRKNPNFWLIVGVGGGILLAVIIIIIFAVLGLPMN